MAQKSIRKNYILNAAYQLLLLITPLITAPYIARVLEPDGVGTASYVESIAAYFVLFATMGITIYGQRETSYVQADRRARSVVFWNTKLLELCSAGTALLAYVIFALLQEDAALYLALSLNIAAVMADVTWFFQGLEEFGKIVARNTVLKCLHLAYIFLFIRTKDDLLLYVIGLGLFTLLGNLSLWAYLPGYLERVPRSELHPFRDIKAVWALFVPTIAIQIYTVLDKTMIGLITADSFQNGYYEQGVKIPKMLLTVVTAMGTVMVPRIGRLFGQSEHEQIRRLIYRGYRFVWFLGIPLCLGLVAVAGNFVPWFFGPGYEAVIPLLRILAFLILAIGINSVTGEQYLIPTKRQNLYTVSVLAGAGVNFCLNMVLIRYFQSFGAAVASVAAETLIALFQFYLVRETISAAQVLREGIHYYIAGLAMLAVLLPLGRALSPSLFHTLLMTACGASVYFLALLIEKDEFFLTNAKKMLGRIPFIGRIP